MKFKRNLDNNLDKIQTEFRQNLDYFRTLKKFRRNLGNNLDNNYLDKILGNNLDDNLETDTYTCMHFTHGLRYKGGLNVSACI